MTLGRRIARLRKQQEWTQDQFAERVGVHGRHISRWERDKMRPSAKHLARIAELFEMSVDELLAEEGTQVTIHDPQLLQSFHQAQELDEQDRAIVVRMVQALVSRKRMEQVLELRG